MMATVPHVTSGLGLRKFQADGFFLTRAYICSVSNKHSVNILMMLKHTSISLFCILFLYCQFIHLKGIRLLTH